MKVLQVLLLFLLLNSTLVAQNDFIEKSPILCKNNKLIIPKNYGISLEEKMDIISLLLLNGNLHKGIKCGGIEYQLMPHILSLATINKDHYFAQLIFNSNLKYLLGEELLHIYFLEFQLPLIIKYKKIDSLEISDDDFEFLVDKFCSNESGNISEMIKKGFFDRRRVLQSMQSSNFKTRLHKSASERISCVLDGIPYLIKNEKWNSLLE